MCEAGEMPRQTAKRCATESSRKDQRDGEDVTSIWLFAAMTICTSTAITMLKRPKKKKKRLKKNEIRETLVSCSWRHFERTRRVVLTCF